MFHMKASGCMGIGKAMGFRFGRMAPNMLGIGMRIRPTGRELSIIRMETFMRESGSMIKLAELEHTSMATEQLTWASGRMISKMEWEDRPGRMEKSMKENTKMEQKMGRVS